MKKKNNQLALSGLLLLGLPLAFSPSAYAAKAIDLSHQTISVLQNLITSPAKLAATNAVSINEVGRSIDFNQTLHIRVQETYAGVSIFGGDAIVHIPQGANTAKGLTSAISAAKNNNGSMDGVVYQDLTADLANAPAAIHTQEQADKSIEYAINLYQSQVHGKPDITAQQSKLIVYIDDNSKAHWAYQVTFNASPLEAGKIPSKPVFILDAVSFEKYKQWNNIKTMEEPQLEDIAGGGYGGNVRIGKVVYDGLAQHLPQLSIQRDAASKMCYLQNADVKVKRCTKFNIYGECMKSVDFTQSCNETDPDHNNVYWNGEQDAVNGGYSPSNDALYNGAIIKDMYQQWYNVPVLSKDNKPMLLTMIVHLPMDNAYWDGEKMNFGDGQTEFYPLSSSLGVSAHEISHGFTEQHTNLVYEEQSGSMNESFSDMAAQAAELFAYGKNAWLIGPEVFKEEGQALRYMDQPSKDGISIDNVSQYSKLKSLCQQQGGWDPDAVQSCIVHTASGVYNHFFYLLGTSDGWDAKKVFDVMVQANSNYWTSTTDFAKGACGVIKATKDYNYDVEAVKRSFKGVGIDTSKC